MILAQLFFEFFHIGLLSFGGGYATLPFLYHIAEFRHWYTAKELTNMIAVSSITPGHIGINVATFAGFKTAGIIGSMVATASIVLPSFILVLIISRLLKQFKQNKYVRSIIYTLKPAGCALLAAVGVDMFFNSTNVLGMFLLLILFGLSLIEKRDPLFYLGISALAGIVAGIFGWV